MQYPIPSRLKCDENTHSRLLSPNTPVQTPPKYQYGAATCKKAHTPLALNLSLNIILLYNPLLVQTFQTSDIILPFFTHSDIIVVPLFAHPDIVLPQVIDTHLYIYIHWYIITYIHIIHFSPLPTHNSLPVSTTYIFLMDEISSLETSMYIMYVCVCIS